MIQTRSDYWVLVGLALAWLAVPAFGEGGEGNSAPDVSLEMSRSFSVSVTDADTPQTIAQKMAELDDKLEVETGVSQKSWLAKKFQQTKDKFNFVHRVRLARREVNAAEGAVSQIPLGAVLFNGAAAIIGIHVLESVAIGPGLISLSNTGVLPDVIATGLKAWGTLLINPVPTGVPLIDFATESFCWMTLIVVKTDVYHRGMYWIEMKLVKVGGALARLVGLDVVWNALLEKRSGLEAFSLAMERDQRFLEYRAEDLSYFVKSEKGRDLARLRLSFSRKTGDLVLDEFELFAAAASAEGRRELAARLKPLGRDIRDAILNPDLLVSGGHGTSRDEGAREIWTSKGTSVLLRSHWVLCKEILAAAG